MKFYTRKYKNINFAPGYNGQVASQNELKKMYYYLYNNANIFLERKKELFLI